MEVQNDPILEDRLLNAINTWSENRPRTQQRTLGPSSLGGCRAYLRGMIAQDIPQIPERPRGVDAAFIGTVMGDAIETILAETMGAQVQVPVSIYLERHNLTVAGNSDLMIHDEDNDILVDLKGCDGIAKPRAEGASLQHMIQLSVYMVGAVQNGLMREGCTGALAYYDRSGKDKKFFCVTITWDAAQRFIELLEDRLDDVLEVIDAGSQEESRWSLRDQSPSLCFATQCPFRMDCWGGSEWVPTGKVDGDDEAKIVDDYAKARVRKTTEEREMARLRQEIIDANLQGVTPDGWVVSIKGDPERRQRVDVMPT